LSVAAPPPLLITDKAAADVRPTFDLDAIAEITSHAAYAEFSERLKKLGFQEDAREALHFVVGANKRRRSM
jgi:hypothetical protein